MTIERQARARLLIVFAVAVAQVLLLAGPALGQAAPEPPKACSDAMDHIASGGGPKDIDITRAVPCFWELAPEFLGDVTRVALRAQAAVQKSSSAMQTGAPTGSNGTTSAVSKPNTSLASLASEYGGITSSTSNQTVTLQTTLDAIPTMLVTHGLKPYCWSSVVVIPYCVTNRRISILNRFGLGITANTSSSSQNVTGTASALQGSTQMVTLQNAARTGPSFGAAFAKFSLYRGKSQLPSKGPHAPNSTIYNDIITTLQGDGPVPLQPEVLQSYLTWSRQCLSRFTPVNMQLPNRNEIFWKYYAQVVDILFDGKMPNCTDSATIEKPANKLGSLAGEKPQKAFVDEIVNYMASISIFESQLQQMITAANKAALSLEYDFNKPLSQPTISTVKLVGSSRPFGPTICPAKPGAAEPGVVATKRYTATVNLGAAFYNSPPTGVPGASAFRDAQAGAELDAAFCTTSRNWVRSFFGNSTTGLTYYYQDQVSPSILKVTPSAPVAGITIVGLASTTSQVFAKKGPINFIQLKYGLGFGKNVKFPIAVSWSNRTDLITHALWSAQFGVSYDFSSLFGSPNTPSTTSGGSR